MLEFLFGSAALAQAPAPLPEFSQYPSLNYLSAAFTIAIGVFSWILWLRGQTAGIAAKQEQVAPGPAGTQIFLDGPVQKFLGDWDRIADSFERLVKGIGDSAALRSEFFDMLKETRHYIANVAQGSAKDAIEATAKLEERLRKIELDHNTLAGTVNQIQRQLDNIQRSQNGRAR